MERKFIVQKSERCYNSLSSTLSLLFWGITLFSTALQLYMYHGGQLPLFQLHGMAVNTSTLILCAGL